MIDYLLQNLKNSFKPKSIQSLDGIRAISCLFVIIGHFSYLFADKFIEMFGPLLGPALTYSIGNQYTGVTFFFVLSGFLITNILIQEHEKSGTISYKKFFLKRVFRIFPAYYFYFAIVLIFLSVTQILPFSNQDIWAGFFYLSNYLSDLNPWPLGHFWSLAVEEQFYLFWPLLFLMFHKKLGDKFPLFIILVSPIIRIATYFMFPEMRGRISIMTHTRFDSLLFGCYLAYLYKYQNQNQKNIFDYLNGLILKFKLQWLAAFHILFFSRLLQTEFKGKYLMTVGYTLDAFMMCLILVFVIQNKNAFTNFLNKPFMIHLGTISYSLYLWHMPFAWSGLGSEHLILRLVSIYFFAIVSFIIIETPFMIWREKILNKQLN